MASGWKRQQAREGGKIQNQLGIQVTLLTAVSRSIWHILDDQQMSVQ